MKVVAVYTCDCYNTAKDGTKTFSDVSFATFMEDGSVVVTFKIDPKFKCVIRAGVLGREIFDANPEWSQLAGRA